MADRSRFAKNTVFLYGLQIAKYVFPLVTIPYLTRVLGPDTFAIRAYVLAAMSFMFIFLNFGFIPYGTRAIVATTGDPNQTRLETSTITYLRIAFAIVGGLALVPLTMAIPLLAQNPAYVAIAYLGTVMRAQLPDFVFQGQEDMGIMTYRFVASQAVAVVLIFALVHSPAHLLRVAIIETLASFIGLAWSWENVIRKRGISFVHSSWSKAKSVLQEANVFFIGIAATTAYTSLTTILIGIFVPDQAQISYWSLAITVITAVQALYAPIQSSLYPHMIRSHDWDLLKKLLAVGIPLTVVGVVAIIALDDVIMLLLGGKEYLEGAAVIAYLAPLLVFSYPAELLGYPVLSAIGWTKEQAYTSVIAGVFHLVGMGMLIGLGTFTIPWVALLRCCTEAVLATSRVFYVGRNHRMETAAKQ